MRKKGIECSLYRSSKHKDTNVNITTTNYAACSHKILSKHLKEKPKHLQETKHRNKKTAIAIAMLHCVTITSLSMLK